MSIMRKQPSKEIEENQDYVIIFWKIGQNIIEVFIKGKEVTIYIFCENMRKSTIKT